MRKHLLTLYLGLLLFVPVQARASIITYDFGGVINSVTGFSGLSAGQTFTGSFAYSTDTLLHDAGPDFKIYSTALDLRITAGGVTYMLPVTKYLPTLAALAYDTYGEGTGGVGFHLYDTISGTYEGAAWTTFTEKAQLELLLTQGPGLLLPALRYMYDLDESTIGIPGLGSNIQHAEFDGSITSFSERTTPTPIPAAVWLLGTGLAGLAGARRLRKRQ